MTTGARLRATAGHRLLPAEALGTTVIRAGIGLYYNDLAQNGWVTAFQAVNEAAPCVKPGDPGCLAAAANGRFGRTD